MLRSNTLRLARPAVSQVFMNDQNGLRNGWWLALFLGLFAALLFGAIIVSAQTGHEISVWEQVGLIAVATAVVQLLRRKPIVRSLVGFGPGDRISVPGARRRHRQAGPRRRPGQRAPVQRRHAKAARGHAGGRR